MVKIKTVKKNSQTRSAFFDLFFASQKGMSLVELILVIAIIGIGASVTIVSLSPARTQSKLKAAQTELAANIKLAQSYALQGKMVGGTTPKAFGLKILMGPPSTYEIFYCDDPGCVSRTSLESFLLEDNTGVTIDADKEVIFDVPNGNPSSLASFPITITLSFSTNSKTVTITSGGSIQEN